MKKNSDNNHQFILNHMEQKIKQCKSELVIRRRQLQQMDNNDRDQWVEIMTLKSKSLLAGNGPTNDLVNTVVPLVMLSKQFGYSYNQKLAQEILKSLYVQEMSGKKSNSQIVKTLKEANYDAREYQLLQYEDPWYSRLFRWMAD